MTSRGPAPRLRVYSILFVAGLLVLTFVLVGAALGASDADRGGYVGMAVLWGSLALAAATLLVALERRRPRD